MPPKKGNKESKKTENKKKEKVVQDKTFGLKNKKGAKQQKFVKQVQHQVATAGDPRAKKLEQQRLDEKKRKEEEKRKKAEIDALFKEAIVQPKLGKGVDPKSVLCQFHKAGKCQKGDKCKYSHDLAIERKSEKRSVYATEGEELENDTIDQWDDDKLKEVVEKKHGDHNKKKNKTAIVCKFFIRALEKKKYGWFWHCPNGDACIYRHALPPGFVLKCDLKKMDDQTEKITIEELIEKERAALGANVTKVTLQTFMAWKQRKKEEKKKELNSKKNKRKNDFKSGKTLGVSGREVFEFQPDMVGGDDAEAGDDVDYTRRSDDGDDGADVKGVSSDMFVPKEVDETLPPAQRLRERATEDESSTKDPAAPPGEGSGEPNTNGEATKAPEVALDDVDESLFTDDLDAELDGLEL